MTTDELKTKCRDWPNVTTNSYTGDPLVALGHERAAFMGIVSSFLAPDYVTNKLKLAREMKVAQTTVDRWARGISMPNIGVMTLIVTTIERML
jgi:hypothetical protein